MTTLRIEAPCEDVALHSMLPAEERAGYQQLCDLLVLEGWLDEDRDTALRHFTLRFGESTTGMAVWEACDWSDL